MSVDPKQIPRLSLYPALEREVERLRLHACTIDQAVTRICEENGFEYRPGETLLDGYRRLDDLLARRPGGGR